jgi:hypothetical protein
VKVFKYLDVREQERLDSVVVMASLMDCSVREYNPSCMYGITTYMFIILAVKLNLYLEYEVQNDKLSCVTLQMGESFFRKETLSFVKYEDGETTDKLFEILYSKL